MKRHIRCWIVMLATMVGVSVLWGLPGQTAWGAERHWQLMLDGFFTRGRNPITVYARERDNQWVAAMGSSIIPGSLSKYSFNKSYHWVDMSKTPITDGLVKGPVRVHLTPDLWVPSKHLGFTVDLEVDATVKPDGTLDGSYKVVRIDSDDPTAQNLGSGGKMSGFSKPFAPIVHPDPITFDLNLYGSLIGGPTNYIERCMMVRLGFQGQAFKSGIYGAMSLRGEMHGAANFQVESGAVIYNADQIKGKIVIPAQTLDLSPCEYTFEIDGRIREGNVVGAFKETAKVEGGETIARDGCFDGKWSAGIQTTIAVDARSWWTPVKDFQPVQAGEHPRLLFRRSDLPALRRRAETPEGRAILARLRRQLNGGDGETMPTQFSKAVKAYDGNVKNDLPVGAYTIGHVAGYGLLYQLTGEKKYADLGKECFELALKGQRDRDDRYSWKAAGEALRAGPTLGWYAMGYDLCYDGWDEITRARFAAAIQQYDGGKDRVTGGNLGLETLVRGTMPPGSNHYGMQVGGAAMALLAVMNDPFVDQKTTEVSLKISEQSIVRNLTEGFGDGGFFREGDGTGSMSSQIAYLNALQAWRTAMGHDYVNVDRPNARMTVLKWIYLTVIRNGRPDVWPIRGDYPHIVWERGSPEGTISGAYFGIGFGAVTEEQKAAMKWYYNHFMLKSDEAAGGPYDTMGNYPHMTVCSFVNWPVETNERNPSEVLPLCYRDSICSFYAWRNRWQDEDDIVISVLTKPTTGGYMRSKADSGLQIAAFGKKVAWGQVNGEVKHWWMSPRGQTSVLTTESGISTAVDFSKTSGADAMLVTTGAAEGAKVDVGGKTLTFKFLMADAEPEPQVHGDKVVVGGQTVSLKDGNLVLGKMGGQGQP